MKYILILLLLAFVQILSSAPNTINIDGAEPVKFYLRNYAYTLMPSNLPVLSMGLANDVNRLVYKNSTGTIYKIMTDASGSSNAPQGRVFYADANGAATSSSNFSFDGSMLNITGKLTTTDSIKGGSGTFSTGVTAYDATSDGAYIGLFKGLGSLSGYPSNRYPTIKTDNANMYFDCSGKYVGAFGIQSFYIRDTSTSGGFVFYVHNDTTNAKIIKADGVNASDVRATDTISGVYGRFTIRLYTPYASIPRLEVNDLFAQDTIWAVSMIKSEYGVEGRTGAFSEALTSATLNTGHGDNELYAMNQNTRSTDNVTFNSGTFWEDLFTYKKVLTDTVRSKSGNSSLTLLDDNNIYLTSDRVTVSNALYVGYGFNLTAGSIYTKGFRFGEFTEAGTYRSFFSICDSVYNNPFNIYKANAVGHVLDISRDTAKVTGKLVVSGSINTDALTIGNTPILDTGTFTITWTTGFTTTPTTTVKYQKTGNIISCRTVNALSATSNTYQLIGTANMPSTILPSNTDGPFNVSVTTYLPSGASTALNFRIQYNGVIIVEHAGGGYWSESGIKGFLGNTCFTYLR